MNLREVYKKETGEDALYRMKSSDYHTLRYVNWLEARAQSQEPVDCDDINSLDSFVKRKADNETLCTWNRISAKLRSAPSLEPGDVRKG